MNYKIAQNPNYANGEKPFHVIGPEKPRRASNIRKNLTGVGATVRGHEVEIEETSFSDPDLLEKLRTYLDNRSIEFKLV